MEAITQLLLILASLSGFFLMLSLLTEAIERAGVLSHARTRRARGRGDGRQRRDRSARPRRRPSTKGADPSLSISP